ncbi:MAG: TolC family protein [Planctomycetaceae bacterium]|jgi:cobalt-zinc-cadmium efflux system outer membrane protein|nr:TolC family protein [Planctomycetaceae bacterium]
MRNNFWFSKSSAMLLSIGLISLIGTPEKIYAQVLGNVPAFNSEIPSAPKPPIQIQSHHEPSGASNNANAYSRQLSIREICDLALNRHPAIIQASRQMEAYRGSWVQAGLKENPTIGYSAEEVGGQNRAGRQGIAFSYEHISKQKLSARQNAANAEYLAAREQLQMQRQKVVNDATLAGYRLLIASQKERLAGELLKIAEMTASSAESLSKAQETQKTDFLQAKIEKNRVRITLNDAVIEREAASKNLAVLIGFPTDVSFEITDSLDVLPIETNEEEIYRQIMSESPLLKRAYAEHEAAKAKLRKEQKEAGINVSATGSVLYNTSENQTEASLGISVPLRINNRNQGNIMRANSELLASAASIERIKNSLTSEFQNQFAQYKTARDRVLLYQKEVIKESEESLNVTKLAYEHGECSYIELLNAQRTMFSVQIECLDNIDLLFDQNVKLNGFLLQNAYLSAE